MISLLTFFTNDANPLIDPIVDGAPSVHSPTHSFHVNSFSSSPVALQLRAPPKVSARAPAHRSYHFRGVKLKSCIKKIHHNLYISKQANVRIKHADTEGASHKKFGTDARVQ